MCVPTHEEYVERKKIFTKKKKCETTQQKIPKDQLASYTTVNLNRIDLNYNHMF